VTSGDVNPNQTLQLRLTTSAANSTTRIATLVLGTATVNWEVTTKAAYLCNTIGQSAAGGKCAQTGPNALIAHASDVPPFVYIGSYQNPWSESVNYCKNLSSGGYSDWFAPSLAQLNILFQNRFAIGGFQTTDSP